MLPAMRRILPCTPPHHPGDTARQVAADEQRVHPREMEGRRLTQRFNRFQGRDAQAKRIRQIPYISRNDGRHNRSIATLGQPPGRPATPETALPTHAAPL